MCETPLFERAAHVCDEAAHPVRDKYATFPKISAQAYETGAASYIVRRWAAVANVPLGHCIECNKQLEDRPSTPPESLLICFGCRRQWQTKFTERLKRAISVRSDQPLREAIAAQREREEANVR
jgi:hypothetical protein